MMEEVPKTSKVVGSPPVGWRVTRVGRRSHFAGWQTGIKWSGCGHLPICFCTTARRAPSWATMAKRPPLAVVAVPQ